MSLHFTLFHSIFALESEVVVRPGTKCRVFLEWTLVRWAIWVSCSTHLCNILTDLKWGSCQIIIIRNIRQKMTSFLPCCMGTSKVDLHYICIRPKHGKRWFPEAYVYILLVMIHVLLMFSMLPFLLSIFSRWVSGVVPFSDVCTSLPVHCCKDYGLFIAVREVYVC